jgi:hypothetical protein
MGKMNSGQKQLMRVFEIKLSALEH